MIKRIIIALIALLFLTNQVSAAWLINSYRFGEGEPVAEIPTLTFIGCTASTSGASSHTFTSHNVGTAGANRDTIIGVSGIDGSTSFNVTSLTVGGVSATELVDNGAATSQSDTAIYIVDNPVGTAENIVVNWSETIEGAAICVWAAYDLASETPFATGTDDDSGSGSLTANTNTHSNGFAIGVCGNWDGNERSGTLTGLTEVFEGSEVSAHWHNWAAAHLDATTTATPLSITCDWDVSDNGMSIVVASWYNPGTPPVVPSLTFIGCTANNSAATTYTYTSHNVGTAGTRSTIVGITGRDGSGTFNVSSVTVGGTAATEVSDSAGSSSNNASAVYIVDNPVGTAENIVVTWSESIAQSTICVWAAYNLTSITPVDSAVSSGSITTHTLSLDTQARGVAVGVCNGGSAAGSWTWVGLTERADAGSSDNLYTAADVTAGGIGSTPLTVSCSQSSTAQSGGASGSFR